MNNDKFISSDQSTLKHYYKSCAKEALDRKDKREYQRYKNLIEEMEAEDKRLKKNW